MSVDIDARRQRQKEYYLRRKARDPEGLKRSTNAATMRWRTKNPERQAEAQKNWRKNNSNYQAQWRTRNKDRRSRLMREAKHKCKQRYPAPDNCECCGVVMAETIKGPQFDHDHTHLVHRGWLCNSCNNGIARLGDSLEGVRRAVAYLERTEMLL